MHDRSTHEHLDSSGREIALAHGLPAIPERLLLAHARGEVLFLCGAGVSRPAGLPDFRQLALEVYRTLDPGVWEILTSVSNNSSRPPMPDCSALTHRQAAEVKRFLDHEYDVVLGMLERRLDSHARDDSKVRGRVVEVLRSPCDGLKPTASRSKGLQPIQPILTFRLASGANPPRAHPASGPRCRNDDHDHQLRPLA